MQPPYDVLNLYHVIRLNWSSFLNRIVRAPARARARFFCFLYCLFPRSHYCARPMRFGLKASTEKAWKDTGKASKTQIHMVRQVRSAWIRNDAGRYEFYFTCISYQSAGFQKFFFSRAPTCAERCAPRVPRPLNFSRPHFEDRVNTKTYCKTGNCACSVFSAGIRT